MLSVKLKLKVDYFEEIPSHVEGLVIDSASIYPKRIATVVKPQIPTTDASRLSILVDHIGEYTSAEFAQNHGLPESEISRFTSGEVPFDKDSALQLAEKLKLPLIFFEGFRKSSNRKADLDLSAKRGLTNSDALSLNKTIGKRLKEERVRLHFSIGKFCERLAIETGLQTSYEMGEITVPASYLSLVKTIFDLDVKYILTGVYRPREDQYNDSEERMFIIAEKLKEERSKIKISKFDFATELGITLAIQTLYESGLEPIPASYLSHAAALFNIDLEYILTY